MTSEERRWKGPGLRLVARRSAEDADVSGKIALEDMQCRACGVNQAHPRRTRAESQDGKAVSGAYEGPRLPVIGRFVFSPRRR